MQTIAVLGANGRLSNPVAKAFHAAGYRVVAVTRSGKAKGLPAEIEQRAADAMDRQALISATSGADILFNGLNPAYTDWGKYVLPMGENVMAAARSHSAFHLFPGNVYNFGRDICEDTHVGHPQRAETRKGPIRIALEQHFEREAGLGNVRTAILRAGDFFGGSIRGTWFDLAIAEKIGRGIFTYPGPMDLPHGWAYLPDLAETFVRLADHCDALQPFQTFHFTGHSLTGSQLRSLCEHAAGRPLKRAGIPWPLLRAAGVFSPMLREICEMSYLWRTPHSLDGSKLKALIARVPHTEASVAVAAALSELGVDTADRRDGALAALSST